MLYFYLAQDLDLLLPIALKLREAGLIPVCFITWQILKNSPRTLKQVRENKLPWSTHLRRESKQPNLLGVSAVVTAVETSANPHRLAQVLVKRAKARGIPSYTVQHGLENIGLTYFDQEYPEGTIKISSDKIFTWGKSDKLHPSIDQGTRQKCIPVGCPKIFPSRANGSLELFRSLRAKGEKIVVIFENLHWGRYSDKYRKNFLDSLERVVKSQQSISFLIKPHHAGKWLTERSKQNIFSSPNLTIANPSDPTWEPFTAPALINIADAVITTPSTVAFDAAIMDVPVAVVAEDLNLSCYHPMLLLNKQSDWMEFLTGLNDSERREQLVKKGRDFVKDNNIDLEASSRIANYIRGNLKRSSKPFEPIVSSDL